MTERANHPLRDKSHADALRRVADSAFPLRRAVMREYGNMGALVMEAVDADNALAHARLYSEVCANIDAARQAVGEAEDSLRAAARLMDPDLTDVSDFEEDLC